MTKKGLIFLISSVVIYLILLTGKLNGFFLHHLINGYFTDLICIPLISATSLVITRKIQTRQNYLLSKKMILLTVVYVAVVFELILPTYSIRYTADAFDVVMYFIGGWIFYSFQKDWFVQKTENNFI